MKPSRAPLSALLYAGLCLGANAAYAQVLDADTRANLEAAREGDMRKLVIHETPVEIDQTAFTDAGGAEMTLDDSNGRLRLVNFWATWCAPCRQEKPALDALQRSHGSDAFEVVAIASGRNDLEAIKVFNAETGVTALETHLDPQSALARAMRIPGLPVTVVVNREGDEIARLLGGADWQSASAREIVETLIALP